MLSIGCSTHLNIDGHDAELVDASIDACLHDACAVEFDCEPGNRICEGQTPMLCDRIGIYHQDGDSCSRPTFICDPSMGRCVDNPLELIGKNDTTGVSYDLEHGSVYAQPVRLPWDATLDLFGIRTTATSTNGRVYLALYSDDGSETGAPADLINRSAEVSLVQGSENERAPFNTSDSARKLAAGTRYWIVAYAYETTGNAARVSRDPSPSAEGHFRAGTIAYGVPAASLRETETFVQTGQLSIWIKVRRTSR